MTNEAALASSDQSLLVDLDAEFSAFRHRIATMSVNVGETSMRMLTDFALVEDVQIIDIEAIEWETFDLASMLDATDDSILLEFAAA